MTPLDLSRAIEAALAASVNAGDLSIPAELLPSEITVERTKSQQHGDYATNIAMRIAKSVGRSPRSVAQTLVKYLEQAPGIAGVDVAGPGFLNITLEPAAQGELARTIWTEGARYGHNASLSGQRINLEFVSANPTGPVHIGSVRWAAVGDSLARILKSSGAEVVREYYFNDHGAQIERFARSLVARAKGEAVPTDGYTGAYLDEIVAEVLRSVPAALEGNDAQVQETFRSGGVDLMFSEIKQSLHDFGVDFDVYFHENHLYETGAVWRAIDQLRERGHIYEHDGAVWLRSTTFGDDKDRVIVKSDGNPAYISGDFAYYLDKRERGFQRVIIMLGADHHGYIGRMMAMCQAFGDIPGENLEILIGQMVNLVQGGKPLRMSKRAGNVVTLEDLVAAVGVDAARYAIARSSSDSTLDIDLDLLTRRTNDNPVYYVQYAHARICSLLRHATELKISFDIEGFQPALLHSEREGDLLRTLGDFPKVVLSAAELREPHRIARYLEELATAYHKFYDICRVLPRGDEPSTDVTAARLVLCSATRQVLANGLELLGVSAPERM